MRTFDVEQHDGLRWNVVAFNQDRLNAERAFRGLQLVWPTRCNRIVETTNGARTLVRLHDPRGDFPHAA